MKKNTLVKKLLLLLVPGLLLSACQEDESSPEFIAEELQSFFDAFAQEGAARGWDINFDDGQVLGRLESIEEGKIIGQCVHNSIEPEVVRIDKSYWVAATPLQKEFVVFHELGHCVLNRDHLDTKNADGTCLSIMNSGTSGCRNVYSTGTRSKYLDELFIK